MIKAGVEISAGVSGNWEHSHNRNLAISATLPSAGFLCMQKCISCTFMQNLQKRKA